MIEHGAHYIGGRWQPSNGKDKIAVVNAATEEVMGVDPGWQRRGRGTWPHAPPARRSPYGRRHRRRSAPVT